MEKKVSIAKIDKYLKSVGDDRMINLSLPVGDTTVDVTVKKYLTFSEETAYVQTVADAVFADGVYNAAAKRASKLMVFIASYTNIKLEIGVDRTYALAANGFIDKVLSLIDMNQYLSIMKAIDAEIDYRLNILRVDLDRQIKEAVNQIEATSLALADLQKVFKDIDPEDVQQAVINIAKIDTDNVIDILAERQKRSEH